MLKIEKLDKDQTGTTGKNKLTLEAILDEKQ